MAQKAPSFLLYSIACPDQSFVERIEKLLELSHEGVIPVIHAPIEAIPDEQVAPLSDLLRSRDGSLVAAGRYGVHPALAPQELVEEDWNIDGHCPELLSPFLLPIQMSFGERPPQDPQRILCHGIVSGDKKGQALLWEQNGHTWATPCVRIETDSLKKISKKAIMVFLDMGNGCSEPHELGRDRGFSIETPSNIPLDTGHSAFLEWLVAQKEKVRQTNGFPAPLFPGAYGPLVSQSPRFGQPRWHQRIEAFRPGWEQNPIQKKTQLREFYSVAAMSGSVRLEGEEHDVLLKNGSVVSMEKDSTRFPFYMGGPIGFWDHGMKHYNSIGATSVIDEEQRGLRAWFPIRGREFSTPGSFTRDTTFTLDKSQLFIQWELFLPQAKDRHMWTLAPMHLSIEENEDLRIMADAMELSIDQVPEYRKDHDSCWIPRFRGNQIRIFAHQGRHVLTLAEGQPWEWAFWRHKARIYLAPLPLCLGHQQQVPGLGISFSMALSFFGPDEQELNPEDQKELGRGLKGIELFSKS